MSDPLEIRLLGPFEVLAGGRPVNVSGSKRHALLALLALRCGRVAAVDALVDALWAEDLPAAPRNAVQHHVVRLRAALGQEAIVASPDGYALRDADVDALRFEELVGEARASLRAGDARGAADAVGLALGLWRGPALHGLTDTAWFSAEARRLESLRLDALEERFEAALALGDHREIVSSLRATIEESPFRERLWGQLMLALYRSGRQADALDAFHEARRVLSEELGLAPGPDLRRLQEAILAQDARIAPVPVAPRRRGNLPAPATSFVGREAELAQVVELLRDHRLVTLNGPPGVGKTRLALEAARALESESGDGAWLVDLARAGSPGDVARLVAQAVDARGADPFGSVVARLGETDAILVFDACEHSLEEARMVASALLADCAAVRVLATSREALHLRGEARVHVEPLPLPDAESGAEIESPALQLFVARARAARPGFQLTPEAAPLAAEITRRVDGLPLAIELAAARVNVLGLAELLSIVERRLALFDRPASDPGRTALQELVEWSYDLLHADEKTLLQQLAVHRGGASLQSLVAAGADHGLDEATVTYLLGALVDKSIVSVSFPAGDARYDVLDTVRDYVLERLLASGDLVATRRAHADYFATLADEARSQLRGPRWLAWTKRLEPEADNLWAALGYARETPDPATAARLAGLGWYFALAERVSEGRRFVEDALAVASGDAPLELHVEALAYLCYLETEELDLDSAVAVAERALSLARTGAPLQGALVKVSLALAVAESGDPARGAALAEEGRIELEAAGDSWGAAASSLVGAEIAAGCGDVASVAALTAATLRHSEAIGYDAFQPPAMLLEAWVAERRDDREAAVGAYRRALELAGRVGFADHAAFALVGLGSNALAAGDLRHAEELQRQALASAEAVRSPWVAAHARVQLGRVLAAGGDADTAERSYRSALEWAEAPRPHTARESLFLMLAGNPASAALLELADLAAARGDTAAAGELRERTGLALT